MRIGILTSRQKKFLAELFAFCITLFAIYLITSLALAVSDLKKDVTNMKYAMFEMGKENSELKSENKMLKLKIEELNKQLKEKQDRIDVLSNALDIADRYRINRGDAPVSRNFPRVRDVLFDCEVTWYTDSGLTAMGVPTIDEFTMAVDPDVIPLGSRLVVEMPDGTKYYGLACDTGGAVIGKTVDIHTTKGDDEAFRRGRTHGVKVYVIG